MEGNLIKQARLSNKCHFVAVFLKLLNIKEKNIYNIFNFIKPTSFNNNDDILLFQEQ